jgi:hypothetical protein
VKFVAIDSPHSEGAVYRSDKYDLVHSVAGFGISLVRVYPRVGQYHGQLAEFTGHNALNQAMAWCEAREAEFTGAGALLACQRVAEGEQG